jgi:hypothetical protein
MDTEYFKGQLRQLKFKDVASNEFLFSRQTTQWIALKGPFDVYFTLSHDTFPKVKVMLTLEDTSVPKRASIIKNCIPDNEIQVENNAKRRKDVFSKEYDWVDKKALEAIVNKEFMGLLKQVRNELDGKNVVVATADAALAEA